jgi:hypothetical protein
MFFATISLDGTGTKSLDPGEADFFRKLDRDAAI